MATQCVLRITIHPQGIRSFHMLKAHTVMFPLNVCFLFGCLNGCGYDSKCPARGRRTTLLLGETEMQSGAVPELLERIFVHLTFIFSVRRLYSFVMSSPPPCTLRFFELASGMLVASWAVSCQLDPRQAASGWLAGGLMAGNWPLPSCASASVVTQATCSCSGGWLGG